MKFGAHCSGPDFTLQAQELVKLGADIIQIYLPLPGHQKRQLAEEQELKRLAQFLRKNKIGSVIHTHHTVNLGRDWNNFSYWIQVVVREMEIADQLGAFGVVVHCGERLSLSKSKARNNMFGVMLKILEETQKIPQVKLILETGAGQGSQVAYRLPELAHFYHRFQRLPEKFQARVRLCVDSCHVYAAGYDLRGKQAREFLRQWEELIGWDQVVLFHLNDSQRELGSRKDRHATLGEGEIGKEGLGIIVREMLQRGIPMILETSPEGHPQEFRWLHEQEKEK